MPTAKNGPSAQGRWGPRRRGGAGGTYVDGFVVGIYWTRVTKKIPAGRPSVGTSWERAGGGLGRCDEDDGVTVARPGVRHGEDGGTAPGSAVEGWGGRGGTKPCNVDGAVAGGGRGRRRHRG